MSGGAHRHGGRDRLVGEFAARSGYEFADGGLLEQALTHSGAENQRLEFLGDRVLGLVIADALLERYPERDEGALARQLNSLVRKETCADVARGLGLDNLMLTGQTTRRSQAQASINVLGDLCEAVIAAIFLDGGLEAAKKFIISHWQPLFERFSEARRDAKSLLQEKAVASGFAPPAYVEISRSGPDHAPRFVIEARVEGLGEARGEGASKRKAQQAAAGALLKALESREDE